MCCLLLGAGLLCIFKLRMKLQQLQMQLEKVDFVRLCLPCFSAGHIIMMCAVLR